MKNKKRSAWLKYIIYLIFLPFTLTYFILKNDSYSIKKKFVLISIVWVLFSVLTASNNSSQSKSYTTVKPSPTRTAINVVKAKSKPTEKPKPTNTPVSSPTLAVSLVKIIDGDTIDVNLNGKTERVRLIGIDTPEMNDYRSEIQCFAQEAKTKAQVLLTNSSFTLQPDSTQMDRDKYNRLLRYVIFSDKSNLAKLLIEQGYGYEYTYNVPYKYQQEFKNAQKTAKNNQRGLWNPNHPCNTKKQTKIQPTTPPVIKTQKTGSNTSSFTCGAKRYCTQMTSCEEAYFYMNNCGLSRLDGDKDGVPCESLCN